MKKTPIKHLLDFLGIQKYRTGHTEKIISGIGAFFGIFIVLFSSTYFIKDDSAFLVIASMGASAVLLFSVPHGPLSQPWALIGGHLFSAIIGVSCAKYIPNTYIAAPLAVALAVSTMYYLNCIHPPGGATALSAVIGGESVHQLGYQFILTPILINVIAILIVAITFNYFFQWRRYPAYLANLPIAKIQAENNTNRKEKISHEDFIYALSEFDSFLDISENDLLTIYDLVIQHHHTKPLSHQNIALNRYYSNGEYGDLWSVRQIVNITKTVIEGEDKLSYKVVAGSNRRTSGEMTKIDFAHWAKHEVTLIDENWLRVNSK